MKKHQSIPSKPTTPEQREQKRTYLINLLNRIPQSEIQLQSKCAELLYFFYPDHWRRFVTVFNNSLRANISGFGIVPGCADTYWLSDNGRIDLIEFKFGKTAKQSDAQKEFEAICVGLGHFYHLCYDEPSFWKIIGFRPPNESDIDNLKWFA